MKNLNGKLLLVAAVAALIIISGCTGSTPGPAPGTGGGAPGSGASGGGPAGGSPSGGGSGSRPAAGSVEAVSYTKLINFLPNAPSGWTAEEPMGGTYSFEQGSWTSVSRHYTYGDTSTADVGIMDSAYYEGVGWFALWEGQYKWETTEGYGKTTTIKGYPAYETYSKSSKSYSLMVSLNDRFMVYINTYSTDKGALDSLANSINFAGIAALG